MQIIKTAVNCPVVFLIITIKLRAIVIFMSGYLYTNRYLIVSIQFHFAMINTNVTLKVKKKKKPNLLVNFTFCDTCCHSVKKMLLNPIFVINC